MTIIYVKYGLRLRPRNFWTTYGNDGHCGREEEPREFSDLVRARDEDQLMPLDHLLFTKKQVENVFIKKLEIQKMKSP